MKAKGKAAARKPLKGRTRMRSTKAPRVKSKVLSTKKNLHREDELLHAIVDASPIPLIITRVSDGTILYANKPVALLAGLTVKKFVGRKSPDFYYDPADRKIVLEKLKRNGVVRNHEVRLKKTDGTPFWAELSIVQTEIGGESVIIGALPDISERKSAEEALKQQAAFVHNNPAPVLQVGFDGNVIGLNLAARELFKRDLTGESVCKCLSEFDEIKINNIRIAKPFQFEQIIEDKVFLFTAKKDEPTNSLYIFGSDITERKQTEEALRVSEERFRGIVENAEDVIYSMTAEGVLSYISPKFRDITGYEVSEFTGESFTPLVHPEDRPAFWNFFKKVIETGEAHGGIEYRIQHKNGSLRWFTTHASAIKDEEGNVVDIIGIVHDITEMKKVLDDLAEANRHIRETQTQLVQSEKMASLGMLVAGIAHEINTPIGAVYSMNDTLMRSMKKLNSTLEAHFPKEYKEDRSIVETLKIIKDANRVIESGTQRVTNIVKRLRSFARLDEAELKKVDIHEGLEDTLTLMHHAIKNRIQVAKIYGEIPQIACYPGQLNQVFLNLLINANQAINDHGVIKISTFQIDHKIHIVFEDNGAGISKENLNKIFDPGFTTKGIGTGLGLSICYQIIKDHKGAIWVESEVGKGSKFTVIIPMNLDEILEET